MRTEYLLDMALDDRIIFVLGATDTGKTTCIKELANALYRKGYSVGILDADVGQSDIGPPTTIGFGVVEKTFEDFHDLPVRNFYFIGSISPKGHLLQMVMGVRKMLDAALNDGLDKILIDTTGLVSGQLGRILKEQKIQSVQPDVIICLQHEQECEHLLSPYRAFPAPRVIRCVPDRACRSRSQTARQHYRERMFQIYFEDAPTRTCSLAEIGIFESHLFRGIPVGDDVLTGLNELMQAEPQDTDHRILWGEFVDTELLLVTNTRLRYQQIMTIKQEYPQVEYVRNMMLYDLKQMLVGILDQHQHYCALGIINTIDFSAQQAAIITHAAPQDIAGLTLSSYVMRPGL